MLLSDQTAEEMRKSPPVTPQSTSHPSGGRRYGGGTPLLWRGAPKWAVKVSGTAFFHLLLFFLLAFSPASSFAQYNIDRVLMAGRSALYYEDYVLSMQYFNQAIHAKPYLYEPWFYRAVAKFYLDDFVGAEMDCNEAIRLNPYISNLYDLRGICRIRQQKYDVAADDYTSAIREDPTNQGYWYNRALCRLNGKDYDQANLELDSMMTRWSKSAKVYQLKCEVCLQQKDTAQAEHFLDKSLELDPYDAEAWTVRAMMSLNKKKWRDADKQLTEAIRLRPTVVSNYVNRAMARYNFNNLRGALADYDKAIELDADNFLAHYNRGQLRVQVGDDNRAIDDFDFIISREPQNIMAVYNRALLLERTGDMRGAIRDLSTVIDQFPNFWAGLQLRAQCYRRLGMVNQAELDEFRIFKAQMDKHIGIQPRWSKNKRKEVRKLSDIDLDKYNQLVEEDEPVVEHEYNSAYRGKVQNRAVEDTFMPLYILTFREQANQLSSLKAFDTQVEQLNHATQGPHIAISCSVAPLTEDEASHYFHTIDSLTALIDGASDFAASKHLMVLRAVAYTVVQDYDAAINDLSAYCQTDSTSSVAYWQRAACRTLAGQFAQAEGIEGKLRQQTTLDDYERAIRLNPQNPYILYDRATFHANRKNYAVAIDDYTKAIAMSPQLAEAWYNRGLCHLLNGQWQKGIEDLSKAGELGLYDAYSVIKRHRLKNDAK